MEAYPEKYAKYIQSGMSRSIIELELQSDGFSEDEILDFWMAIQAHVMQEACESTNTSPTALWKSLKRFQTFIPHNPKQPGTPRPEKHLRIVCMSDTHGLHDQVDVPHGDILIHAGDFTDVGDRSEVIAFNEYLGSLPHKYKIVIAGNHESTFDTCYYDNHWQRYGHKDKYDPYEVKSILTNAVYLQDELITIQGLRIYGTPWQPEFCNWAFNLPRGQDLSTKWKDIPSDIDVLVSHTPPLGRGDTVKVSGRAEQVGDVHLLREVQQRIQPKYHVFGHVHEGYGCTSDGQTVFINASNNTQHYQPTNPCIVMDVPCNATPNTDASTGMNSTKRICHEYETRIESQRNKRQKIISTLQLNGKAGNLANSFVEETFRHEVTTGGYENRAMKYLFDGPFRAQSDYRKEKYIALRPPSEKGMSKGDPANSEGQEDPDYSLKAHLLKGSAKLNPRRTLSRRFTLSILPTGEDEEEKVEGAAQTTENKDRQWTRRRPFRRAAAAELGLILEEEEGVTPVDVVESSKGDVDKDTSSEDNYDDECYLCQFKVDGHVHNMGKTPAPSTQKEEISSVVDQLGTELDEISVQVRGTSKEKRASSWF